MSAVQDEAPTLQEFFERALRHDYWHTYAEGPAYYRGCEERRWLACAMDRLGRPAREVWSAVIRWREEGAEKPRPEDFGL